MQAMQLESAIYNVKGICIYEVHWVKRLQPRYGLVKIYGFTKQRFLQLRSNSSYHFYGHYEL